MFSVSSGAAARRCAESDDPSIGSGQMYVLNFIVCVFDWRLHTAHVLADAISACIAELSQAWRLSGFPVLVLATTDGHDQTAHALTACFKHEIEFQVCPCYFASCMV